MSTYLSWCFLFTSFSITMYDFAIIGAGAAGLQLAIAMSKDDFFNTKKILLIDKDEKNEDDKTWCYWEKSVGKWDHIIHHTWDNALFYNDDKTLHLKLSPYRYKMLKSIDFYSYAKKELMNAENINWVIESVEKIIPQRQLTLIKTDKKEHKAQMCFDSRIPTAYYAENKHIKILQHFKGCTIKFRETLFDPTQFTMMDFRLKHENTTSFMYILPTAKDEALFEFTLFTPQVIQEHLYDHYIKEYIHKFITKSSNYEIKAIEKGIIPMTNFPFHRYSEKTNLKIGAAGSWIRPSTGYSFKNAERYVNTIITNIKNNKHPNYKLLSKKNRLYDTLLLDILNRKNETGPLIFEQMYTRNSIQDIFQFLDGTTSFLQDFKVINSFDPRPFIISIFNQFKKIWSP